MVEARPETVLSMLVARTKDAVRRLDNKNYRAARKIFMLNNHNGVSRYLCVCECVCAMEFNYCSLISLIKCITRGKAR